MLFAIKFSSYPVTITRKFYDAFHITQLNVNKYNTFWNNIKAMRCQWKDKVLNITEAGFEKLSLDLFRFQYENNTIYQQYVNALQVEAGAVQSLNQVPFLPIRLFKSHVVKRSEERRVGKGWWSQWAHVY